MTSIEDLDKRLDSIIKRNEEMDIKHDFGKRIRKNDNNFSMIMPYIGFLAVIILLSFFIGMLYGGHIALVDIQSHVNATENLTKYLSTQPSFMTR